MGSEAVIRSKVEGATRLSVDEARWLATEAPMSTLSELATMARDRHHPPGIATYLIMAIVNTTNICVARCDYCAFYRLPKHPEGYLLTVEQIAGRIEQLKAFGGTMVGFNGGFNPKLKIDDYARMFAEIRERFPDLEFYEMTVAEFMYACKVSKVSYEQGAQLLREAGTRWVTGGGAEVMAESFRKRHSPLKYTVVDYYDAQRAIVASGLGTTATMVIGFDETLDERLEHLDGLRTFQDDVGGALPSFLCWTYKPYNSELGGDEITTEAYLRWLAVCRLFLDNLHNLRTSVLTQNAGALQGLRYGANDFDLPTEDEVTQRAGATIDHDFERVLDAARGAGYDPVHRTPFAVPVLTRKNAPSPLTR